MELESYLEHATPETHIVLTDLTKAFGKANREILWTTLYKKGIPLDMITHIRRGGKQHYCPKQREDTGNRRQTM